MSISSLLPFSAVVLGTSAADTAIMNIIRHGEKCANSGNDLHAAGYARADYLAQCMSSSTPSKAMPFGKATAVMAGEGKHSLRPKETVTPLAKKLGLKLHMPCSKREADCFAEHALTYLTDQGTLVVAWAHESIPPLLEALKVPHYHDYRKWPQSCQSASFEEPACCSKEGSVCYDAIWQVRFTRSSEDSSWQPQSITSLAEGFGGHSSSRCAQDLALNSNAQDLALNSNATEHVVV